ncbi:MAG: hypothetical protein LBT04_06515 [Prevotellaceae bacterium]|jgi:ABC-type bacteriocin/lantibiotic exporter with double-glycine peptidase domain|nr:hypothetical protein [Prevotellaceae bacterium]
MKAKRRNFLRQEMTFMSLTLFMAICIGVVLSSIKYHYNVLLCISLVCLTACAWAFIEIFVKENKNSTNLKENKK